MSVLCDMCGEDVVVVQNLIDIGYVYQICSNCLDKVEEFIDKEIEN